MKKIIVFLSLFVAVFFTGNAFAQQSEQAITVSGKSGGSIAPSEIIAQQLITASPDQTVESFTIVVGAGDQSISIEVEGSYVTKKASNHIRTKPDGTPLKITNIILKTSSGEFVKADDLSFTIFQK
jgi:hypothetical protein